MHEQASRTAMLIRWRTLWHADSGLANLGATGTILIAVGSLYEVPRHVRPVGFKSLDSVLWK